MNDKNINIRLLAVKALVELEGDDFSQNIIDEYIREYKLNKQNSSFFTYLVYGVIEKKLLLDYVILSFTGTKFKKITKEILNILRIGIFQILFMNSVPNSAAVNESVKLAYKFKQTSAKGLVNAILRKVTLLNGDVPLPKKDDMISYLSVKCSVSTDIINVLKNSYGIEKTEKILESFNEIPPVSIRVNNTKTTRDELFAKLEEKGLNPVINEYLSNNIFINNMGDINRNFEFKRGHFHIQDTSSQIAMDIIAPKEDNIILDLCSAPGGKSFTMAEIINNKGTIYSVDRTPQKIKMVEKMATQLGLDCISTLVGDSSVENDRLPEADIVLCDVPCSGIGVIKKKPEIRYKNQAEIEGLAEIQYKILFEGSKKVKENGKLIYTTCTLNTQENEDIIKDFLDKNQDFEGLNFNYKYKNFTNENNYMATIFPDETNSDGFFIATLVRKK